MYKRKTTRGRKRKTPDTAIMKLVYDNGYSTYSITKSGVMNGSQVYNSSFEDISRLRLSFFIKLGKILNMKPTVVIDKLFKLQKIYPPKIKKRSAYKNKKNKTNRTR